MPFLGEISFRGWLGERYDHHAATRPRGRAAWVLLSAPSGPHAKKKAQTTAQRAVVAEVLPGGMVGASRCTDGPYYGPGTAQQNDTGLPRGFARGLPGDNPDRHHGIFSVRLSTPMIGLVGVDQGRWV